MKKLKHTNMKKFKHRRSLIENPMETIRPREFPFVHSIQTNDERRVYTFHPRKDMRFYIVVEFPIQDYGEPLIEVAGEKIEPEILKSAIDFVCRNEMNFSEVFEDSFVPEIKRLEVGEKQFQELNTYAQSKSELDDKPIQTHADRQ